MRVSSSGGTFRRKEGVFLLEKRSTSSRRNKVSRLLPFISRIVEANVDSNKGQK